MKQFGGPAVFIDRGDINTDEIIPAKYLTEISKQALKPHLLEDLKLEGFDPNSEAMERARVLVTRSNFGCGSSREHAVWAFEVNDINVVIAESYARIFRQNCFNCGILAIELSAEDIEKLFAFMNESSHGCGIIIHESLESFVATSPKKSIPFKFNLNEFDKKIVQAGGWLAYADQNY